MACAARAPCASTSASTSASRARARGGRPLPRRTTRARAFEDLGADDVASALDSFSEEDTRTGASFSEKSAHVFRGTMDEDVFERVDEQKAKRRVKREAVEAATRTAPKGGARRSESFAFLYEEKTDVNSPGVVTKCNDVLRQCQSMEEVLDLVKEMREAGVQPVESTYVAVMLVCRSISAPERAVQVYDAMVEAQVGMNSRTFQLAIELALKAGMIKDALRIKDDMRYLGFPVSSAMYVTLLKALADNDMGKRKGPNERLIRTCRLFEEMLNEDIDAPPAAYHTLILAANRANQHDLAIRTFEELVDEGITPTRLTCETALESMAKSGLMGKALDVFVSMKNNGLMPRKVTYNFLLSACVNAPQPRVEAAFEIFDEMRVNGDITPDKNTYTLLIDAACKAGMPEKAFEAFSHMRESGVEVETSTLNRLIHAAGLNGTKDESSVQATLELYEAMKKAEIKPDVITYGSLISTCAKARDGDTAIKMYEEMRAAGIEPNRILFNVLISALGRCDRSEEAIHYFETMVEMSKKNQALTPHRETYAALFDAILGSGGVELAIAKQSLESGATASFVNGTKFAKLRDMYNRGVKSGVYEEFSESLSIREPESGSCTINMNMLSRTESTVATLVLLERMSKLKESEVPPALFIYAGKVKPGKSSAHRRLLVIETVLRASEIRFEIGEVGAANLIAIKGSKAVKWIEKYAATFAAATS